MDIRRAFWGINNNSSIVFWIDFYKYFWMAMGATSNGSLGTFFYRLLYIFL